MILAFQMSVIRYGISIAICQAVVAAPLLWTVTPPLKPVLQESLTENWPCRSPEASGGVALSSLVIVPAPTPSASVAPVGLESTTVKPSLASTTASPIAVTWMVFVVSPAAKVSVPDLAT